MENSDFGNKLIQARLERVWTQMKLAEESKVSLRTIQRIESNQVHPRAYTILQLSESLGVDFNNLPENTEANISLKQFSIFVWLKKILWHFFDLFNLKTNTMKKLFILSTSFLGLFFLFTTSFSSTYKPRNKEVVLLENDKSINKFEKNYIQISNSLYASSSELTNIEYKAFLKDLKLKNKLDLYKKCIYDSIQWTNRMKYSFHEPYVALYHWHPSYDKYPIVNISKEAMDLYCNWLTEKYNSLAKRSFKKVKFRLPTEKEWRSIASPLTGHNLPWEGDLPYKRHGNKNLFYTNIKIWDYEREMNNYVFDGGLITIPIGSFKANKIGVFDVIGNVSEVTQEGKIKGGSWDNYIEECGVEKRQRFKLPDPRVGFRVVMEVIEE